MEECGYRKGRLRLQMDVSATATTASDAQLLAEKFNEKTNTLRMECSLGLTPRQMIGYGANVPLGDIWGVEVEALSECR